MNFVDIQVNGHVGVDFLVPVTAAQIQRVAQRLRHDGVRAILPTIITNDLAQMAVLLSTFRQVIDAAGPDMQRLMPAFHIEGPCLSPEDGYRGAHQAAFMRPASRALFEPLLEAAGGPQRVAMVTLAPEMDRDLHATRWLAELGIVVAVGHTNAPLGLLRDAQDAGVRLFTHFGNGCATMVPHHDNILNRALSLEKIHFALIPDGHHVPWFLLRNWIRWVGLERCMITTDGTCPAGGPPGRYHIGPYEVEVGPDGKVHPPGQSFLAGSALTMPQAYANVMRHLELSESQARVLCCENPGRLVAKWLVPPPCMRPPRTPAGDRSVRSPHGASA
ncbi:MAG: hypothetical protein WD042_08940 [Phycisphaeraceae bacterium]